ncbi:hypothetical protein [Ralstonia solanacearum]|uniref:hypothetical protein n=1 Tax=Ralstonia solanacearum TaxID=305 RepID=UPI0005ACCD70|nr:hypothetical protein [Ralstonia solanacearum]MDC6180044.1 hypothetical protein [Ralstonia solanacearum]MDC6241464.1 hypothetical protein [Ralstonia solanacearum]
MQYPTESVGTCALNAVSQQVLNVEHQSPIEAAIHALRIAAECGGELDLSVYRSALLKLMDMRNRVLTYTKRLDDSESVPGGGNFIELLSLIGLDTSPSERDALLAAQSSGRKASITHSSIVPLAEPVYLVSIKAQGSDGATVDLGATYLAAPNVETAQARAKVALWNPGLDGTRHVPVFETELVSAASASGAERPLPFRQTFVTGEWFAAGTKVLAYTNGLLWNGWQQPFFPKSSAMQIASLMPGEVVFNEVGGVFRVVEESGESILIETQHIEVEGRSVEVYSVGSGWCWVKMPQRLFIGNWAHLFGPGRTETACRIVVDIENNALVAAQAFGGMRWFELSAGEKADLAESLFEANDVSNAPGDFDLVAINSLPYWAAGALTDPASRSSAVTANKTR